MSSVSGGVKLPAITQPGPVDQATRQMLLAIREVMNTREGLGRNSLDRFISMRDLLNAGLVKVIQNGRLIEGGGGGGGMIPVTPPAEVVTPPAPTGLSANGGITRIIIEFDRPTYGGHSFAEIWRSATNDLGTAVLVGVSYGWVYSDAVEPNSTFYYWVRFVSTSNTAGPYNGTAGTLGQTSPDPAALLDLLNEKLKDPAYAKSFVLHPNNFAIRGPDGSDRFIFIVDGTAVIIDTAYIKNGSISDAKIGTLSVDKLIGDKATFVNANITQLDVAKLIGDKATFVNANITYLDVGKIGGNIANFISANMGSATIGTAHIQDAAVNTLKLAGQAVTIPVAATSTASATYGASAVDVTVLSLSIASSGAPINVFVKLLTGPAIDQDLDGDGTARPPEYRYPIVRIYRSGVLLYEHYTSAVEQGIFTFLLDQPGAGTYTYSIRFICSAWNSAWHETIGGASWKNPGILLLETKR